MLVADNMSLREIERDDLPLIVRWRNQPQIWRNFFSRRFLSLAAQEQWFTRYLADESQRHFAVIPKGQQLPVGLVTLNDIDQINQKAEIGVFIGELNWQGKGIAHDAVKAVMDYAFTELNLRRLQLRVLSTNTRAIRLYHKLGFLEEGRLREAQFTKGGFIDVLVMGCLKNEWYQNSNQS